MGEQQLWAPAGTSPLSAPSCPPAALLGILYEDKERQDFIFTIYHWWQAIAVFAVYLGSSLPMKVSAPPPLDPLDNRNFLSARPGLTAPEGHHCPRPGPGPSPLGGPTPITGLLLTASPPAGLSLPISERIHSLLSTCGHIPATLWVVW